MKPKKPEKTKQKPPAKKQARILRERPKFPRISEEMKQWAALLGQELRTWPQVHTKPMFGMLGFFRRKQIFAALPVSRSLVSPNSLILRAKLFRDELTNRAQSEPRISTTRTMAEANWIAFELNSDADLRDALWWLSQAYEAAKK